MSNSNLVTVKVQANATNYTKGRTSKIQMIAIHHMAGILTAKQCGNIFAKAGRGGSSHYGIGKDGEIGQFVDEEDTAWTNSNWDSNCKSVTIETSNCEIGGDWKVSDKVLSKLIELVADIAKRNKLGKLVKGKNVVWHSMYIATNCPGKYLLSKMDYIVEQANKINGQASEPEKSEEPDYTGVITYQAYTGEWLPEVNKCDDTDDGFAGIGTKTITGFRCKPQYGEITYEAHLKGGNWIGAVNSKDYKKNDTKNPNSYAGIYGKPIDGIRIKSTRGYVDYRAKTKEDGWLPWARGFGSEGDLFAGIYGHEIIGIQMK